MFMRQSGKNPGAFYIVTKNVDNDFQVSLINGQASEQLFTVEVGSLSGFEVSFDEENFMLSSGKTLFVWNKQTQVQHL